MASYRFSASIIGRSTGRSITAAAAYRAACELTCDRYGEQHDYSRKQGVVHSDILMPPTAPAGLRDREQLWNAVEAAERRKDAQLAREVQLSLPHELTDAGRRELVRSFVLDQFVSQGMIADVNIHAPHRDGDGRNTHAHVLLTMRPVTREGFGKKARDWNTPKQLEAWREAWADHQNRTFQRLGLSVRVDHRSLEDQGIDRTPQQHRGAKATAMERRGMPTRIGDKNRLIDRQNAAQSRREAALKQVETRLVTQRARFAAWKDRVTTALSEQHRHARDRLSRKQTHQIQSLEKRLKARYGAKRDHAAREAAGLKARLSQKGLRGFVRKITGAQAKDSRAYQVQQQTLAEVRQAIAEHRHALVKRQAAERDSLHRDQKRESRAQAVRLQRATERKEQSIEIAFTEAYDAAITHGQEILDKPKPERVIRHNSERERGRSRSRQITHGLDR